MVIDTNRSIFDLLEHNMNDHDPITNPKTITFLFGMLFGYRFALKNNNIIYNDVEIRFDEFQEWLVGRIGIRENEFFLHAMLRNYHTETGAYHAFFQLLAEYSAYVKDLIKQLNNN